MRTTTIVGLGLGLAAACGGSDNKPKDAAPTDDAAPTADAPIDAPELPACANPVRGTRISFRSIGDIGQDALLVTAPPGDPRLFVVAKDGRIRLFKNETLVATPFLDLRASQGGPVLSQGGENGLLGLAFHPQYASNGLFFVYYTKAAAQDPTFTQRDVVARCKVSATDPDRAETTCVELFAIRDRFGNHNGGMIEFGGDGLLYIGTGDGGDGGDPDQNGQAINDGQPLATTTALLGKMLRIDVDNKAAGKEYGIPSSNPFAAGGGAPEIFMIGLRNPWRWSFDRATGDMWIADVGQDTTEEVNWVKAAQLNGGPGTPVNFGWDQYEGNDVFQGPASPTGKTMPVHTRSQGGGQPWESITGGSVYRGSCYPDIVGHYFFADYVNSRYARATVNGDTVTVTDLPGTLPANPVSLHADARGELYLTSTDGRVLHLEAGP